MKTPDHSFVNQLAHASSPYLLQHANNPVQWYEWEAEALEKARKENKPIFLSIGYSACHWCHVMAHECFEDQEIAGTMNQHFINIKVDREEHPELDEIYMSAVQFLTGSGGWPLSVWLTPDLQPFFGGTYFPPDDRYGRPGFKRVLLSLAQAWQEQQGKVVESAKEISGRISQTINPPPSHQALSQDSLDKAFFHARRSFDPHHGGFSAAPKFPQAMVLSLLLRYYKRTGNSEALNMVEQTLTSMAAGGIYDQLGGGFHRYSTDERWLVPHFEKMLYDQALLTRAYGEAYQLTQKPLYRRIVRETADYVLARMTHPQGGCYSAEDADSNDVEGAYYVWGRQDVKTALGANTDLFCAAYGISQEGNWDGSNILFRPRGWEFIARENQISEQDLAALMDSCRMRLFDERQKRISPSLDDKVLTDWNGLMISAMSLAYRVSTEPRFLQAAEKAARFIWKYLFKQSILLHSFWRDSAKQPGYLSDYAFLISGLIDLYQITFDLEWMDWAIELQTSAFRLFADDQGGFYYAAQDRNDLIARSKNLFDNAIPSGNSVMIRNLLRLSNMTGNQAYHQQAIKALQSFAIHLESYPSAHPEMLIAHDYALGPSRQIVIAGKKDDPITREMLESINARFLLHTELVLNDGMQRMKDIFPLLSDKASRNGRPLVYVCKDFTCQMPVGSAKELEQLIKD
jgi:uncharacterized protein YyaL (SSP411 family)